jgi:uncharacterized protein (UPF0333 family)
MMKKGQAAMEYLVLTGFTLVVLSILLVASYLHVSDSEKQLNIDSAERAVTKLQSAIDFVYIHGHPTKLEVHVYFPPDIQSAYVSNSTVNLAMGTTEGYTDIWRSTIGEADWDVTDITEMPVHEGYYVLVVESTDFDSEYSGVINVRE